MTQALQRILFKSDGTRRPDSEIAVDAEKVIADLIKQGVMKQQDAPAKPIKGFDDANKFVNDYPMDAADKAAAAPTPTVVEKAPAAVEKAPAPATTTPGCPADRPWLCPNASPSATQTPAVTGATPAPPAGDEAKTPAPPPAPKKSAQAASGATSKKPASTEPEPPFYVFGPNDVLQVSVFDEKMIPGTYAVGPDGRISMPLIGTFRVVGLTAPELSDLITEKLKDEGGILEPIVNVQLLRSNSKQYTLIGGFGRTGPVPLVRDTTVLDAIAAAGGFREFANKKDVQIRRGTQTFHFNYNEVVKGKNLKQNILVEDGDLIISKE